MESRADGKLKSTNNDLVVTTSPSILHRLRSLHKNHLGKHTSRYDRQTNGSAPNYRDLSI